VDRPNREGNEGHRGECGRLRPVVVTRRIVKEKEQQRGAEKGQSGGQERQRRGAHEVEVKPPQNHRRNPTTIPLVISQELLEILACPKCHTKVEMKEPDQLRCPNCKVLYPIVDGIPVMLIAEAKPEAE
jgi:uncharacterized protein YbaR (Trm112 family)